MFRGRMKSQSSIIRGLLINGAPGDGLKRKPHSREVQVFGALRRNDDSLRRAMHVEAFSPVLCLLFGSGRQVCLDLPEATGKSRLRQLPSQPNSRCKNDTMNSWEGINGVHRAPACCLGVSVFWALGSRKELLWRSGTISPRGCLLLLCSIPALPSRDTNTVASPSLFSPLPCF